MKTRTQQGVKVRPARRYVIPNDSNVKMIFKLKPETYQKCIRDKSKVSAIEKRKYRKGGIIYTPIEIFIRPDVIADDPSMAEPLGQFDCDVANVCISEWEAGNRYLTCAMIYRSLTGKVGDSDSTPSKDQLAKIKLSLNKLMNVHIKIDLKNLCEKLGYNNKTEIRITGFLLPAQIAKRKINGQKTIGIEMTAESPLLQVAKLKNNQILSCDMALLHVPKQKNTPLNIELKHYVLRRVLEIMAHRQMRHTITFNDVFEKCRINKADNKKKFRAREFIKSFFEHLVNCGIITSFEVTWKAGAFHSIEFTFVKKNRKNRPTTNEKQIKEEPTAAEKVDAKPIENVTENEVEKPLEKLAETSAETSAEKQIEVNPDDWIPRTLAMSRTNHWLYSLRTLTMLPWFTGNTALFQQIITPPFFLF